ncbi:hypothetical protein EB118_15005 [bacterium]|nr:hypothetical protein [bacterium]
MVAGYHGPGGFAPGPDPMSGESDGDGRIVLRVHQQAGLEVVVTQQLVRKPRPGATCGEEDEAHGDVRVQLSVQLPELRVVRGLPGDGVAGAKLGE